jgi:hypothetical protein
LNLSVPLPTMVKGRRGDDGCYLRLCNGAMAWLGQLCRASERRARPRIRFAGYGENDFAGAGRRDRISDGVMVLAAGSRALDRRYS